jgi:hypothetical protein
LVEITLKKVLVVCLASAIILGLSAPLILSWNQPFQNVMYSMYLEEKKQLTVTNVSWDPMEVNTILIQAKSNYDRTFNISGVKLWYEDLTYGYEEKELPQIYNVSSILRPGTPVTLSIRIDRAILQPGNYGVILQTDKMPYWSYPGLAVSSESPAPEPSPRAPTPSPFNANNVHVIKISWDTSQPNTLLIQAQSLTNSKVNVTRVQFWYEGTTETGHGGTWNDIMVNLTPIPLHPFTTETLTVNLKEGVLQPGSYKVCILTENSDMFFYSGYFKVQ